MALGGTATADGGDSAPRLIAPGIPRGARSRDFLLLLAGQFISQVGDGLIDIAIPWLMLTLTGSGLQLSLVLVARFAPVFLFSVVAGVLADRFNRRGLMVTADVARMGLMVSLTIVDLAGELRPLHLYIAAFFMSAFSGLFGPAKDAFVPKLVPRERLDAANSMLNANGQLAFLISPPIGGILLGVLGPAGIFSADAVTFAVSALTIGLMRTSGVVGAVSRLPVMRWLFQDVAEGIRVIKGAPLLVTGIALSAVLNFAISPIQVLLPIFVKDVKHGGPELFGSLVATLFAGLLLGAVATPLAVRRFGRGRALIGAVLLLGLAIVTAPWPGPLWAPGAALFVAGICLATMTVTAVGLLQLTATDETRGRVFALYNFSTQGVRPLAFLLTGALTAAVDLRVLVASVGAVTLAAGGGALMVRDLRQAK